MTIPSQLFTQDQLDQMPWLTPEEREQRSTPITPEQVHHIMTLIWNKNFIPGYFPTSSGRTTPTASDLEQLNQTQALLTIRDLEQGKPLRYGLYSRRWIVAREEYGWSRYLGDLSDHTKDLEIPTEAH